MKTPSKVLQFAQVQLAHAWKRFQLLPPRPSLDPHGPPYYILEAQGERGDGTVFAVQVGVHKTQYDLLHGQKALQVAVNMANKALQQLQTYTACACKEGAPCEVHQQAAHDEASRL